MDSRDDFEIKDLMSELEGNWEKGYREVYNKYWGVVYSFVFKVRKWDRLCEEIVEEGLIKIWIKRKEVWIDMCMKCYVLEVVGKVE